MPLALPGHGAAPAFPPRHHLFFQRNRAPFYTRDDLKNFGWEMLHPQMASRGKIHEQLQETPGEAVITESRENHPSTLAAMPQTAKGCSARKTPSAFPCRLQTRWLGANAASLPQLHLYRGLGGEGIKKKKKVMFLFLNETENSAAGSAKPLYHSCSNESKNFSLGPFDIHLPKKR